MTTDKTDKIEMRVNAALKASIQAAATAQRQTMSAYVLQATLEKMYGLKSQLHSLDAGGDEK